VTVVLLVESTFGLDAASAWSARCSASPGRIHRPETTMPAFGAEVRTAGTASLPVGLPTVAVGVLRYQR
jgi:hypothetical protein